MRVHPPAARAASAIIAAVLTVAICACRDEPRRRAAEPPEVVADRSATGASTLAVASSAEAANACVPTDAHARHAAQGYDCTVCHTCGGVLAFGDITLPGGSTTANGTISPAGPATSCSVGCHSPLGATSQLVAWNAGPLPCTSCHNNVSTELATPRSSHLVGVGPSGICGSCHDQSQHRSTASARRGTWPATTHSSGSTR